MDQVGAQLAVSDVTCVQDCTQCPQPGLTRLSYLVEYHWYPNAAYENVEI